MTKPKHKDIDFLRGSSIFVHRTSVFAFSYDVTSRRDNLRFLHKKILPLDAGFRTISPSPFVKATEDKQARFPE
jgi:hypothetical protein